MIGPTTAVLEKHCQFLARFILHSALENDYVVVTAPTVAVAVTPTVLVIPVVIVTPLEFVVVTVTTTGTAAPAAVGVAPFRRELMSASRDANWVEYWVGMAELNHPGILEAKRTE